MDSSDQGTKIVSPFSSRMFCSRCLPLLTSFRVEVVLDRPTQHVDFRSLRKIPESSGLNQYASGDNQGVGSGVGSRHLASNKEFLAVYHCNLNIYFRMIHIAVKPLGDPLASC